jgi:hypothetical protein
MPIAALALHFTLSTSSVQARDDFARGMFLVYAYNGDAAYSAFADATNADPRFAMAYAGEALAVGPDLNRPLNQARFAEGKAAIATAMNLRANVSDQERAYIDAIAKRYEGSWPNDAPQDAQAYRRAMIALAERYPEDDDAQVLAAEALLETGGHQWRAGRPASQDSAQALGLVQGVLARDSTQVMADHLCIHLYDAAPDRSPALACAQDLDDGSYEPAAEHLAHMPAHFWIETGDYTHALVSSQRAYALVSQLPADDPHRKYYEEHDVDVGYSAAAMRLDYASALTWAKRLDSLVPSLGNAIEIGTMLRYGHDQEAYDSTAASKAALRLRAVAAVRLGHVADANAIVAQLDPAGPDLALAARLAEAHGNTTEARAKLEALERDQHDAFVSEIVPIPPAEEMIGGLELRSGNPQSAEQAFRTALARYPNDPWALFGLATALAREGHTAEAATTQAQLADQGGDSSFMRVEDL